jgi:hypothetical protein
MANPPHLFRDDRRLDELVVQIRPWTDDVIDKLGFDPRSSYVEDFWLPILGPSTTWFIRRLAAGFEYSPGGFGLDLAETSRSLGLGDRRGQHSPFVRSINRTVHFGLAQVSGPGELSVRRRLPPLNRAQLSRLSPALQARHAAWQAEHKLTPGDEQERRPGQLALSALERGPACSAGQAPVRASRSPTQDALLSATPPAGRRAAPRPRALTQRATGVSPGKSVERS